ncbi:hypothetical protein HME9302_01904 [Alteripontixanthobacter maritimus]|uniref:Uncharacterized protein n=1 Tax=Alteripontixanthobacter maritimus TaxID=2161824 RepID=A0A369QCQ0_9SPHN|nr:hypothetical protein [Alteripontixanthobacter maritimus]RDC60689.1 hypothetical protein HME9302_01904 [Alteripontixanthobacter maritimus]
MSQTFEFYDARAKEAQKEAEGAQLVMVKERALRAEAVWRGLAEQARNVSREREKAEAVRAARREAEQALQAEKA